MITSTMEYFAHGGPIMIPILLLSFWMWLLIAERLFFLYQAVKKEITITQAIDCLRYQLPPEKKLTKTPGTRLVTDFLRQRTGHTVIDQSLLENSLNRERPRLKRSLNVIIALASIAPLLGLLGTVSGMISTFNVISIFGTGNAKAMAGGISEAMITTQSGLLVAIPGVFLGTILKRRALRLEIRLTKMVSILKRQIKKAESETPRGKPRGAS
jgi:biopolymer transport protein ExbB